MVMLARLASHACLAGYRQTEPLEPKRDLPYRRAMKCVDIRCPAGGVYAGCRRPLGAM